VSTAASLGARAMRDARTLSFVTSAGARPAPERGRGGDRGDRAERMRPGTAGARGAAMRELPTASRDRLLDALCVVEVDVRASGLAETVRASAETVTGVSLAFLVTGAGRSLPDLRAAAARLPLGVEGVVVRCSDEGEPSARVVGGLSVLDIGYLDDLRSMLARTASVA
jgi:hypothetical protein